jgi:general secretion pathway protein J
VVTRPAGFTLVELLVALILLGFISMMLAGTLHFAAAAWHRTDALYATAGDFEVAREELRLRLGDIYPYWDQTDPTAPRVAFDGAADAATFLAPAPLATGGGGFDRYRLAIEGDEGDQSLTLAGAPELGWDSSPASGTPLLEHAARIELAYYGPDDNGDLRWQDNWSARRALPQLIRIRVTLAPDDERRWSDLVVSPHIAEDVSCVYDALSHGCRGR